jgi:archaellum component FlaD/FlaE
VEGDVFEGCRRVNSESHKEKRKIKNEDNCHILSLGERAGERLAMSIFDHVEKEIRRTRKTF